MSIVWPCPLTVDEYASAGGAVRVPRPECPSCRVPAVFWSGYWRHVRERGRERKIFVPRVRCRCCGATHALLPAFVLVRRLDAAEPVGAVLGQVAAGVCGVRPAAARAGVPYTTARGWVRRFAGRAAGLAAGFSALAVELGGEVVRPLPDRCRHAVAAVGAAQPPPGTRDSQDPPDLLTDDERCAIQAAGHLYTFIAAHVVTHGPTRDDDLAELRTAVHHIQHAVMAQAAARAYPREYRLLGTVITKDGPAAPSDS